MSLEDLYISEDKIVTKMGRSFLSERVVFRGKDLHFDLKDWSWIKLFVYGISGIEFTDDEVKLLNFVWVSTSYPDKSIWPNHIAALAGSSRTTPGLALSAGIASCEATIFGGMPFRTGIDFFIRCKKSIDLGNSLENFVSDELNKHKIIYGYGRPLASSDERVPHLLSFIDNLSLDRKEHIRLALKVAEILKRTKGLNMNAAAIYAAIGADLGFSPKTFHTFMTLCFVAGMPPCYIEAEEQKEGSFLPIRCDRLNYVGPENKDW